MTANCSLDGIAINTDQLGFPAVVISKVLALVGSTERIKPVVGASICSLTLPL